MKLGWTIHHNGPETGLTVSSPHSSCERFWKGIRDYHMGTKGWSGIAYSWGACPHGIPMMGQGWFKNQFANGTDEVPPYNGRDSDFYTVMAFIGWNQDSGREEQPSSKMIDCVAGLINTSRQQEYCGDIVLPHNAFKWKRCPGLVFTGLANLWNGRPFPPSAPTITLEEDEMIIIDCPGEPALVLGLGDVKKINGEQRNALRTVGVKAMRVDTQTSEALQTIVD